MRRFSNRRRRRVLWGDSPAPLNLQTTYTVAAGAAGFATMNFLQIGRTTVAGADDKWDANFLRESALILGISDWGALQSQLYQNGYRLERFLGNWTWAMGQQYAQAAGADPQMVNSVVQCGIFVGDVDETGNLLDSANWDMRDTARSAWKTRRWLWHRRWHLSNACAGNSAPGAPIYSGLNNNPVAYNGYISNTMYAGSMNNHIIDIKPRVRLGDRQRLFRAVNIFDPAAGNPGTATGEGNWLETFDFRVLVSRASAGNRSRSR